MIRFWPESKKPGNMMPVEKAKGQGMPKMAMPEKMMPEEANPGKIIARPERRMQVTRCHQDTKEVTPQCQTGTTKPIPEWNELTGTHWENVLVKDACQTGMRGIGWTGCIYPK
jgi:hypothetical protein